MHFKYHSLRTQKSSIWQVKGQILPTSDDYFNRSGLPKLKLSEFSGDPLEWPEWSQQFQATVHAANMDDSVKMNHRKTMVTGKAKEAKAGLGYTAEMAYNVAWNILVQNFGKPQTVVNAQLKRFYSFPPTKPDDGASMNN